jgi:DNA (cytosine-5)-methyltransferase 1
MSTKISIEDAARQLHISPQRTRTLCRTQALRAERVGKTWIIDQESVTQYGLRTAHMIAEDHPAYHAPERSKSGPVALSFFSGAMGLDLGMERAGFDIRLACEFDKYCRQTIALNRPDTALLNAATPFSSSSIWHWRSGRPISSSRTYAACCPARWITAHMTSVARTSPICPSTR